MRNHTVRINDEQFKFLFDLYPHDEELIKVACQDALSTIHVPNPIGYTQSGIRVYKDLYGFNSSGYTLVHWDDAKKVTWCLDNGYYEHMPESEKPIIWKDDTEQKRLLSIQRTLSEWAYG